MAKIKADGDTWRATFDESRRDGRMVVFFCTSNGQRPYRVARLGADDPASDEALDALGQAELEVLFARTESMNASPS